jgi:hypothetical protein
VSLPEGFLLSNHFYFLISCLCFVSCSLPIQLYLVDTFTYAASATAAASVFRSMLGFAFPLFGSQMFNALGYGGGNSLLAGMTIIHPSIILVILIMILNHVGLAIVIGIPFPIFLYFYGEKIRAHGKYTR